MFAGIGGFRSGLSHYGDFFVPVGYCEIDPYAKRAYEAIYEPKGEIYFEDARGIIPENLPDIDLRKGFQRGSARPCKTTERTKETSIQEKCKGLYWDNICQDGRGQAPGNRGRYDGFSAGSSQNLDSDIRNYVAILPGNIG